MVPMTGVMAGLKRAMETHAAVADPKRSHVAADAASQAGAADVEQFLLANSVGEAAAQAFRGCSTDLQQMVMSSGSLELPNPSTCILGRIKDAQLQLLGLQTGASVEEMLGSDNAGCGGAASGGGAVHTHGSTCPSSTWRSISGGRDVSIVVEEFIVSEGLDARAADALRSSCLAMQHVIIARGSLKGCANPSAALLARIKDVQQGGAGGAQRANIEPDAADVEMFISLNQVDQAAADALKGCPPGVQQMVMARGSLANLADPSSALLRRIRSAMQAAVAEAMRVKGGGISIEGDMTNVVEHFVLSEGLDERAAEALRTCDAAIQSVVLSRGTLQGLSNPSAALLGRIRDAQQGGVQAAQLGGGAAIEALNLPAGLQQMVNERDCHEKPANLSSTVLRLIQAATQYAASAEGDAFGTIENFILSEGLDARAAEALRTCGATVQSVVLSRGSLQGLSNPSAALLGRIRDAQRGVSHSAQFGGSAAIETLRLPGGLQQTANERDTQANLTNPSATVLRLIQAATQMARGAEGDAFGAVESFILTENLDARAADALRTCGATIQSAVLSRGSLQGLSNPSAALLGRIRDAQQAKVAQHAPLGRAQAAHVGGAATIDVTNPSAAVLGLIQAATEWTGGAEGNTTSAVEYFILSESLDDRAADAIRTSGVAIQSAVLNRGSLKGLKNPSAALLGRIRDAQRMM